jgi:hypothetical protein
MDAQSYSGQLSVRTRLAFRLEDHLFHLQVELERIEATKSATASERTALETTIADLRKLISKFVC